MKVEYSDFVNFQEKKPQEFTQCLVLWESNGKNVITMGIYYPERKAFFDGIGAWLDEKYVKQWVDIENYKLVGDVKFVTRSGYQVKP